MSDVRMRIEARGKRVAQGFQRVRRGVQRDSVGELRGRIEVLEAEVQECRQLNLRLAELTDVVEELLLPVAQRDDQKVAALLEKYSKGL